MPDDNRVNPDQRVWTIAKWNDERVFVEGPFIEPEQKGLAGMEWVEAAKVEVIPLSAVSELRDERVEASEAELRRQRDELLEEIALLRRGERHPEHLYRLANSIRSEG